VKPHRRVVLWVIGQEPYSHAMATYEMYPPTDRIINHRYNYNLCYCVCGRDRYKSTLGWGG
jgi:hypothetical protein